MCVPALLPQSLVLGVGVGGGSDGGGGRHPRYP